MVSKKEIVFDIKEQGVLVSRALKNDLLIEAIRHCAKALKILRSSHIPLPLYFEFYTLIDEKCLSVLSRYLTEAQKTNKVDLNEVYTIIQYTGNILPRLYLLITVGKCFLKSNPEYRIEILKDLAEMTRGEQDPIRGIFLRYYISNNITPVFLTEEFKEVDLSFKCDFIMTNFIECNKLWIRLQFQGFLKERIQHIKDREHIRAIIGLQLLQLSNVLNSDIEKYKSDILPVLNQQLIKCNDVMAQKYIFQVILEVFPVSFHLDTIESLLETTLLLNHDLSISEIVDYLIGRINKGIEKFNIQLIEYTKVFWDYLNELNKKIPSLPLSDFIPLLNNIMDISVDEEKVDNINGYFELLYKKLKGSNVEIGKEEHKLLFDFLIFSNLKRVKCNEKFYFKVLTSSSKWYYDLLQLQPREIKGQIIGTLLSNVVNSNSQLTISSSSQVESLLKISKIMLDDSEGNYIDAAKDIIPKVINFIFMSFKSGTFNNSFEITLKIKNWIYDSNHDFIVNVYPSIINQLWKLVRVCQVIERKYSSNADFCQHYNNLSKQLFRHISRCLGDILMVAKEDDKDSIEMAYKLYLNTATLADQFMLVDISNDFFLQAFELLEEKIINKSFDQISLLKVLIQSLQKTKSLNNEDKVYEDLAIRCVVDASKLLKKQTQSCAISSCSYLWWCKSVTIMSSDKIKSNNKFFKDGKRILECLQKSLRLADSVMDNIMSSQIMLEILEICLYYYDTDEKNETHIGFNYINQLISLIQNTIQSLELEMTTTQFANVERNGELGADKIGLWVMGIGNSYIPITSINDVNSSDDVNNNNKHIDHNNIKPVKELSIQDKIYIPISQFTRILKYIESQKQTNKSYNSINI
ncbi:hypothetical protein TPHA_0A02870 [Tetrapisispora phaffii CBS 4417]|uniref:Vacuolar protein sorting-associated protein 35 n=1 Tax=Tetrapisispora phaffii (strain ATCC 24235 / CBS 4417 / NBRC 1672 / NRRL Y-8282 / UCD 70-5) TaxID=1071381 RepID=G8BN90_TETPH|nr:hypothetical protein TPHA_0A02870 [Tetrapisispora phaffii CBS 4417]CCE61368.1 hypothetical protein TPHA_0A02870 [Tetrapisispora phaffii CBS 4417]